MRTRSTLLLAFVAATLAGASPAFGAFPGENGRILFASTRASCCDEADVWTMTPAGEGLLNLTNDSEAFDGAGRWRSDGRKIVFQSPRETPTNPAPPGFPGPDHELFLMDPDGSSVRQITFNELDDELPAWSPNGREIVFQRDLDRVRGQIDYDVIALDLSSGRERNLTRSPGVNDAEPVWAPHGGRIAFTSDRDGDNEIYVMNRNGTHVQQLTSDDGSDFAPDWSPDGRRIAFSTDRLAEEEPNLEIFAMRADGSGQVNLTRHPDTDEVAVWSPDGRELAFMSFRDASDESPFNAEIFTMNADGTNQVNRTNHPAFDFLPDWQPLGRDAGRGRDR